MSDDHVIPPLRMDQCVAVIARVALVALADFSGEDPDIRLVSLALFLHELTSGVREKQKVAALFRAVADELDRKVAAEPQS